MAERLAPIFKWWRDGRLSDAETAAYYVAHFWRERHGDQWLVGRAKSIKNLPNDAVAELLFPLSPRDKKFLTETTSLKFLFNNFQLKGMPFRARQALVHWLDGDYGLRLVDYVPSVDEILCEQVAGRRLVSALFKSQELSRFIEGDRDALGFILHDLIHAAQFFSDPEMMKGQLGFYALAKRANDLGIFNQAITLFPEFKNKLEYVLSDMNSHCLHLLLYLIAITRDLEKRTEALPLMVRQFLQLGGGDERIEACVHKVLLKANDDSAKVLTDFFVAQALVPHNHMLLAKELS